MKARRPTAEEAALIRDALLGARLLRPYYARALAALDVWVTDGLGTVAVDQWWRLYVDPVWLASLEPREASLVLAAHEVEHLLRRHHRLAATMAPPLARNIAGDAEINDDDPEVSALAERLGAALPCHLGCADHQLAEHYLAALLDAPREASPLCGGGSGAGAPIEGELGPEGGVPEHSAERLREAVAADVRADPGDVPAGVRVWAEDVLRERPRDWRRDLAVVVGSVVGGYGRGLPTWTRLSRRWRHGDPLRPGSRESRALIGLVVDTSGSMGHLGGEVLTAVEGISRTAGELVVAQGDVGLAAPVSRRLPREWRGGGGTDLRPLIEAVDRVGVDAIVAVTDTETPWPTVPPRAPVVVVAIGGGHAPSWARLVRA